MKTGDVVGYKGRNYRLKWAGTTKYGPRAKLAFLDGYREFWVALALVGSALADPPPRPTGRGSSRGGSRYRGHRYSRPVEPDSAEALDPVNEGQLADFDRSAGNWHPADDLPAGGRAGDHCAARDLHPADQYAAQQARDERRMKDVAAAYSDAGDTAYYGGLGIDEAFALECRRRGIAPPIQS
jgi:hypothetical protein